MGQAKLRGTKEQRMIQAKIREDLVRVTKEGEKRRLEQSKKDEENKLLSTMSDEEQLQYFKMKEAAFNKRLQTSALIAAFSLSFIKNK